MAMGYRRSNEPILLFISGSFDFFLPYLFPSRRSISCVVAVCVCVDTTITRYYLSLDRVDRRRVRHPERARPRNRRYYPLRSLHRHLSSPYPLEVLCYSSYWASLTCLSSPQVCKLAPLIPLNESAIYLAIERGRSSS